jgi:hypothetical protein
MTRGGFAALHIARIKAAAMKSIRQSKLETFSEKAKPGKAGK